MNDGIVMQIVRWLLVMFLGPVIAISMAAWIRRFSPPAASVIERTTAS